jgi:hypothetical protein
MRFFLPLSVVTVWLAQSNDAFQLPATTGTVNRVSPVARTTGTTVVFANNSDDDRCNGESGQKRKAIVSKVKKSLAFLAPIAIIGSSVGALVGNPQTAHAGAPVMAMPKAKTQDPVQVAFDLQDKKMMIEAQKELSAFQAEARAIEKESGPDARHQFEKKYKESQNKKAEESNETLAQIKRDLLDEGIDPALDIEGRRQVILHQRCVDLGEISGTKFNVEKRYEEQGSKEAFSVQKKDHRLMIKAMVQDLKNRDMDPLKYFEIHQDKTERILSLPADKAAALAVKYNENLELYGQIAVPKEGETSAKELMAAKGNNKEVQKRIKAEAKAKAASEKAAAKAAAKAEKDRVKEEKLAAKEAAKNEKEAVKVAAAAAAVAASAASAIASSAASVVEAAPAIESNEGSAVAMIDDTTDETAVATTTSDDEEKSSGGIKIVPVAAVVVSVGGGAYAFKMVRDRAEAAEEDRQRQFRMLMGEAANSDTEPSAAGEAMSDLMSDFDNESEFDDFDESPEPVVETPSKKKKRRGLKSVFGKKSNGRETNIDNLVASDANAADFSKTLAKILTFGAPGRFPDVTSLPGSMPLDSFDIDSASSILTEAQSVAGITKKESAEIFANVVNCMLIDIVDLASTSLKEKDQKVTSDAIGIVITFMDLAASLYTSIAEGVDIVPVTYGGDISKGKLEQMYSTYALSGMTDMSSMDEKFDDRVSLLQDVFQINPKKAEGLMMKAMQKNMMEMMKSGEMPDGMEDMMGGFGDMGGMPGMGDGEEPDPEQLKEMLRALKELKDSGSLPESELAEVRNQFKASFGSSIDEIMKGADESGDELGAQDKELLDLMKDILE